VAGQRWLAQLKPDPLGCKRNPHSVNEKLIHGWLSLQRAPEGSPDYERFFWAHGELADLVEEHPEEAWPLILEILRREQDKEVLSVLAAGPLEELLSHHGPAFIERVESEASANARFRWLLGGVYQLFMTDVIWARVRAAAPERW
jgi:hypothetical protein